MQQHQPFGSLLGIGILADKIKTMNPMGGVVADVLLRLPLLRRAVNWMGVRRASKASIVQMFDDGLKVKPAYYVCCVDMNPAKLEQR